MTNRPSFLRCILFLGALLSLPVFSGCVAPPSYKVRPEAGARVRDYKRIVVAPPDVEVAEISAGGVTEKRDDWTSQVAANLSAALARSSRYSTPAPDAKPPAEELDEVRALTQVIAMNHVSYLFAPEQLSSARRPLTHNVGRIDGLADAWQADAVLLVSAHDAYSSAGRKTLVALGFAEPAPAIAFAMLVSRDGEVQWFNFHFTQNVDLRNPAGAQAMTAALLAGLPR
jgi:hypothetical protein